MVDSTQGRRVLKKRTLLLPCPSAGRVSPSAGSCCELVVMVALVVVVVVGPWSRAAGSGGDGADAAAGAAAASASGP